MKRDRVRGVLALLAAMLLSLALAVPALAQDAADGGAVQAQDTSSAESSDEGGSSDGSDEVSASADGCDSGEVRNAETGECERDRDCEDFDSQQEAQDFFESRGGPEEDPHRLDQDSSEGEDDIACEDFDYGDSDDGGTPSGGVDSGLGGTAPQSSTEGRLVPPLGLGVAALLTVGLGGIVLRRRHG